MSVEAQQPRADRSMGVRPVLNAHPDAGVLSWLRGTHYIDPPIRVLALLLVASAVFFPNSFESGEASYVVLRLLSLGLVLLGAFRPLAAGAISAVFFVVFMLVYGELLNPFQEPLVFAAAVLLAWWRWRASLVLSALLGVLNGLQLMVSPEQATPFLLLLLIWGLASVVALAAALFDRTIRRETLSRELEAQRYERELAAERLSLIGDTHDTVSHGLATQAAIIRLLGMQRDPQEARALVAELAIENGEAQQQLRDMLARLARNGQIDESATVPFAEQAIALCKRVCASAEVGGYSIELKASELPTELPSNTTSEVQFMLRELATNMLKHSSDPSRCELSLGYDAQRCVLMLGSKNPATTAVARMPESLSSRAMQLGGRCDATLAEGEYTVRITLPTRG